MLIEPFSYTEEIVNELDSLLQDHYILNELGKLRGNKFDDTIVTAAIKMQTAITNFLREGIIWLRKHYLSKVAATAISQDFNSAKKALSRTKEALRDALSRQSALIAMSQEADIRRQKKLNKICPDQDYFLHLKKQRNINDTRLPQTAASILKSDIYEPWRNGEILTLWCSGLAGAGKTFAASALIDELEQSKDSGTGLAYYYCEFDQRLKQDIRSLIASLTRQLLAQNEDYCDKIRIKEQEVALTEIKVLLCKSINTFKTTYMIIDAMDEFASSQDQRCELAEVLTKLREEVKPGKLRLCITSRPADSIFEILSPATKIPIRASEADITQYIQQAFQRSMHGRLLQKQDPSLVIDVVTAVVSKCGEMYVFQNYAELDHFDLNIEQFQTCYPANRTCYPRQKSPRCTSNHQAS